jgi:hypothetical protein
MILLKDVIPPFQQVAKLGAHVAQVYGVLWESAAMDCDMDPRRHLSWVQRRDCGGIAEWSKVGLAKFLGISHVTVAKSIDRLLDEGYITVAGLRRSANGKPFCAYRVIHPSQLEAQQYAISMFDKPPSERFKNYGIRQDETCRHWVGDREDLWEHTDF